jgi:hypothetical protein
MSMIRYLLLDADMFTSHGDIKQIKRHLTFTRASTTPLLNLNFFQVPGEPRSICKSYGTEESNGLYKTHIFEI